MHIVNILAQQMLELLIYVYFGCENFKSKQMWHIPGM